MRLKGRRLLSGTIAVALGMSIIVTGTWAWQSISQTAKNEAQGVINPGARLHDDFDGRNKDVYVENFSEAETNGAPIFARVRLHEYMEVGPNAGELQNNKRDVTVLGKADAKITDPTTWAIHKYGIAEETDKSEHKVFHQYWKLHYGGKTVYMPTFNKNKDSLKAEINGTFEGTDGNRNEGVRYDDYVKWELGNTKTDNEVYDIDTNDTDEGENAKEGVNIETKENVEHTAKDTKEAQVISIEEWINMDSPVGDYWVYDKDGWAYYANPIMPSEASGLLLDGITATQQPDEEWYYAIHVVGQFSTAGDWGDKDKKTGFYKDGITPEALKLLDTVAKRLPEVENISIQGGKRQTVKVGENKVLNAIVDVKNPTGNKAETYVTWTSEPKTTALVGDKFIPTQDMVGKKYMITATSAFDSQKTDTTEILVVPQATKDTVTGELDGKTYINLGDNTFREVMITEDGQVLGDLVCAGQDQVIGNGDDNTNVVELDTPDPVYGSKFLGPNEGKTYFAVGPDNKLGTRDDIKVVGNPWPDKITNILADGIEITTTGNGTTVKVGEQEKLTATVTLGGKPVGVQDVTWELKGDYDYRGTSINQEGYLTISKQEKVGSVITVWATSKEMPHVKGYKTFEVAPLGWEDLSPERVPANGGDKVHISGLDWYVLAYNYDTDQQKALVIPANPIGVRQFDNVGTSAWKDCTLRTYLNGEWIQTLDPEFQKNILQTDVYTRTYGTVNEKDKSKWKWDKTEDKVFLLSEADFAGTIASQYTYDSRDYASGTDRIRPNYISITSYFGWLRTPSYKPSEVANPGSSNMYSARPTMRHNVYPIMWIKMPTNK